MVTEADTAGWEPTGGRAARPEAADAAALDAPAFALACGVLWAGGVVGLGVLARFGWGRRFERALSDLYRGYDESGRGLAVGAGWAFADGFTGGLAFAWLYNRLRRRQ